MKGSLNCCVHKYKRHQKGGRLSVLSSTPINFYFVRHAFSCANFKKAKSKTHKWYDPKKKVEKWGQITERDPNLTKTGKDESISSIT